MRATEGVEGERFRQRKEVTDKMGNGDKKVGQIVRRV